MKLLLSLLPATLFISTFAVADDHEAARQLREEGRIVPLETVLKTVRSKYEGTLLEVELEREGGKLVYEIEVLDENGRVRELLTDARSGEFLGEEKHDGEHDEKHHDHHSHKRESD